MDIPFEKFDLTLQKYGNISSASCAIAPDEAVREGQLQPGDTVCMPVLGGGPTWGSAFLRWHEPEADDVGSYLKKSLFTRYRR